MSTTDPRWWPPGWLDLTGGVADVAIFLGVLAAGTSANLAQVVSLLAATTLTIIVRSARAGDRTQGRPKQAAVAALAALAALGLRGGVYSTLVFRLGVHPGVAIVPAALAAVVVTRAGLQIFGDPVRRPARSAVAISLIAYVLATRLAYMGVLELLHEEAYYWNFAQHPALSYFDHPGMVAWIIWIFTTPLGDSEFAVRLGAFGSWAVAAWYVYRLAQRMFGTATAWDAVMLFAVLPIYFAVSFVMLPDSPLVACWAAAAYYLYRLLVDERRSACLGLGISVGLGMLSKYTIVLLGPAGLAFVLADRRARRWLIRPQLWLAMAIALAVFSPTIVWNAQNDWASFAFQGPDRMTGDRDFDLPDLIGSVVLLITPVGLIAVVAMFWSRRPFVPDDGSDEADRVLRGYRLMLALTAVPLAVFVLFSCFRNIKLNWTGPVWLASLPLMARFMAPAMREAFGRAAHLGPRPWRATAVAVVLLYAVGLHYVTVRIPGLPYPEGLLGEGWRDVAAQVERIVEQVEDGEGERPIVVGMDEDRLNSWLAFYRGKTARARVGRRSSSGAVDTASFHFFFGTKRGMYSIWFPPGLYEDRTLLLVDRRPDGRILWPGLPQYIDDGGPVRELIARDQGHDVRRIYCRIVHSYRPPE